MERLLSDQQTYKRALRWFRKLACDGMHNHGLNAIETDDMMDLALAFQQIVDREENNAAAKFRIETRKVGTVR